jgi:hypothetical protein
MKNYVIADGAQIRAVVRTDAKRPETRPQESLIEVSDVEADLLTSSPHIMVEARIVKGKIVYPERTIAHSTKTDTNKGLMTRIADVKAADVVFDGTTCFLQAAVDLAKLSIVDEAGDPYRTFQVDTPFQITFPEGGQLYCLSNNVYTYYVHGWK